MGTITLILTILTLIPKIISLVQDIEKTIKGSGRGKEKFLAVMDQLEESYNSYSGSNLPKFSEIAGTIGSIINVSVKDYNETGKWPEYPMVVGA